jgi:hypothetical protein
MITVEDRLSICFGDMPLPHIVQPRERAERRSAPEMITEDPPSIGGAGVKHDNVRAI